MGTNLLISSGKGLAECGSRTVYSSYRRQVASSILAKLWVTGSCGVYLAIARLVLLALKPFLATQVIGRQNACRNRCERFSAVSPFRDLRKWPSNGRVGLPDF